jgi:hypothetical protein
VPTGHQLTFKEALHIVSTDVFLKLIVPDWFPALTKRVKDIRLAFEELDVGFPSRRGSTLLTIISPTCLA